MQEHEKTCWARNAKGTVKNAVSLQSVSSTVIPSNKLSGGEKRRSKTVEETNRGGMHEHEKTCLARKKCQRDSEERSESSEYLKHSDSK